MKKDTHLLKIKLLKRRILENYQKKNEKLKHK